MATTGTKDLKQKLLDDISLYTDEYIVQQKFVEKNSVKLPVGEVLSACPMETIPFFYTTLKAIHMHLPEFQTKKIAKMMDMLGTPGITDEENLAIFLEIASTSYEDMLYSAQVAKTYIKTTSIISESEYTMALMFIEEALFELEQIK